MPKNSIFNTNACRTTINALQLKELTSFLIKYRSLLPIVDTKPMLLTKTMMETPINTVYSRFVEWNKDKLFGFIKIPTDIASPEIITYTHVALDTKQFKDVSEELYRSICVAPEFADKIVFNVTPLVKRNNELNNTSIFQSLFVRDLLSRSFYNTNDFWLTPPLIQYMCKTYSMSVAASIGAVFGLTTAEIQMVAVIFALYFLQQVSDAQSAEIVLRNSNRYIFGNSADVLNVISRVKDVLGPDYATMTLDNACSCVGAMGINRLSEVNRRFLYNRMRSFGPDVNSTAIALEYPPYWLYLILLASSGQKIGLMNFMKKWGMLKEVPRFTDDLIRTQSLINTIS